MAPGRLTLPNLITIGRILACPAVFALVFIPSVPGRFISFVLFLAAALSDLWDGYLARKHGLVTDLGKLLDPLADKIIICGTFVFLVARPDSRIAAWMAVVVVGRHPRSHPGSSP